MRSCLMQLEYRDDRTSDCRPSINRCKRSKSDESELSVMWQSRIKNGMNGVRRRISLTHKSKLGGHSGESVIMQMQVSLASMAALAALMHLGQEAKLKGFSDGALL